MFNKALDFRFMLFEYYKELRINETELVIILFIEHLQQKESEFITPDLINLQSNIDIKTIDEAMVRLVSKGLIEFTTRQGKMVTSLNPLRNKLQELFALDYEKNKENSTAEFSSQVEEIYLLIQNAFGRSLSPVELQTINEWFSYGYSVVMIKEALEQTMKRKRYNIRAIDKALLKLSTAVDYALEGKSAQSDTYRKNIKDTLDEVNKKAQDDDSE
ncbi:MAG: DNA replication protein DnaD [Tenericutes bacterium ADurb.Bin239]|jgi:DNA replication protein|nr:MAG: DNA replication protein DnaD [Tenericutes bacterium ADurb.Bin239]